MNFDLIGILISLVPLLFIGLAIGWGFVIGVRNTRIRIVGVAVSIVAAIITVIYVKHAHSADILALIKPLLANNAEIAEIIAYLQEATNIIKDVSSLAIALVAPIVFAVSFVVYALITWVIGWIVSLIITLVKGGSDKGAKRPGEIITYATAQVLVTFFILMIPVVAYINVFSAALDTCESFDLLAENPEVVEVFESVENAPITKISGFLGGKAISKSLMTFSVDGERTDVISESAAIASFADNVSVLTRSKLKDYGEKESTAIKNIVSDYNESVILPAIVSEVIYTVTDEWLDEAGEGVLGLKKPEFKDSATAMFKDAFNHILEALNADAHDREALRADLDTVANVFGILATDGVFAEMGANDTTALVNTLSSGDTVKKLAGEFGKNPSFKILIGDITNIGMRAIGTTLKIPESSDAVYQKFNDDIALGLNNINQGEYSQEEKKSELISAIRAAFAESGNSLDLDDSVLALYAEALLEDFADYENVKSTDVSEFFSVFALVSESHTPGEEMSAHKGTVLLGASSEETIEYTSPAYAGKTPQELAVESGAGLLASILKGVLAAAEESANDEEFDVKVKEVLKSSYEEYAAATGKDASRAEEFSQSFDITMTSVTAEDIEKTASMKSAEAFDEVSVIVTLDELLVDAKEAVAGLDNEESLLKEAEAIQNIFDSASAIVVKLEAENESGIDMLKEISEDLGGVLDNLGTTATVGEEKTGSLVVAIFQSETVRNSADLDIDTATEIANEATKENADGTESSYTETMGSIATGASVAQKLKNEDEELTEDDIRELLEDMSPKTADMLKIYMTEKRVKGFGVPESKAPIATELINNLLVEMGYKDKYQDTYDDETKGILKMFDLITAARKNKDGSKALFNHNDVDGRTGVSAKEMAEILLRSQMVCTALTNTQSTHGGNLVDPFGINMKKDSADYTELKAALEEYRNNNAGSDARVNVVASFMGITD